MKTYYGFGCGQDISFDVALAAKFPDIKIRLFDPTPAAISHVKAVLDTIQKKESPIISRTNPEQYIFEGNEIEISAKYDAETFFHNVIIQDLDFNRFDFKPWGIWKTDTTLQFFTADEAHGSASVVSEASQGVALDVPVFKLETIMSEIGDEQIDILKLDIEGAEVEVVPQLISFFTKKQMWPSVWCFDMDVLLPHHAAHDEVAGQALMQLIKNSGYTIGTQVGFDICFQYQKILQ